MADISNKFCKLKNLKNESDVEQNFLVRLLDDLGFTEDYRETKSALPHFQIDKGKKNAAMFLIMSVIWTAHTSVRS